MKYVEPKLKDATGYPNWKLKMEAKLKEKAVFNAATDREREIAYSMIVQSVEDCCLGYVRNTDNPAVALAQIATAMNRQTEANLDALTQKLDRMKMNDGENVAELADRCEILFGQLAGQGDELTNIRKRISFMKGLPRQFAPLKIDLNAKFANGNRFSYEQVKEAAIVFETGLGVYDDDNDDEDIGLYANGRYHKGNHQAQKGRRGGGFDRPRGDFGSRDGRELTCFKCLKPGHTRANCRGKMACLNCKKPGHIKRDCPDLDDENDDDNGYFGFGLMAIGDDGDSDSDDGMPALMCDSTDSDSSDAESKFDDELDAPPGLLSGGFSSDYEVQGGFISATDEDNCTTLDDDDTFAEDDLLVDGSVTSIAEAELENTISEHSAFALLGVGDLVLSANELVVDTGASKHVVVLEDALSAVRPSNKRLTGLGNTKLHADGEGELRGCPETGLALLIPKAGVQLLSVRQLVKNGWKATCEKNDCTLFDPQGGLVKATVRQGLYIVSLKDLKSPVNRAHSGTKIIDEDKALVASDDGEADMLMWHHRLGHVSLELMKETMVCAGMEKVARRWGEKLPFCRACVQGKMTRARITRKLVGSKGKRKSVVLEVPGSKLYVDIFETSKTPSLTGKQFGLQVLDDATDHYWCLGLKQKSDATAAMRHLLDTEFAVLKRFPKKAHSDRGGEFVNETWKSMLSARGIKQSLTAARTPEHNGRCERAHRTLIEMARVLLLQAGLGDEFWLEAVTYACWLINVMPQRGGAKSRAELWSGVKPDLSQTTIPFGAKVYFLTGKHNKKFGKKGQEGILLGPSLNTVGGSMRIYNLETKRVVNSRDYRLEPTIASHVERVKVNNSEGDDDSIDDEVGASDGNKDTSASESDTDSDGDGPMDDAADDDVTMDESSTDGGDESGPGEHPGYARRPLNHQKRDLPGKQTPTRGGRRLKTRVDRTRDRANDMMSPRISSKARTDLDSERKRERQSSGTPPRQTSKLRRDRKRDHEESNFGFLADDELSFKDLTGSADEKHFRAAMRDELRSMLKMKVWKLQQRCKARTKPLGLKWVLTLKRDESGAVIRHKARLCAKGFAQQYGRDYVETSSPVVTKETVRACLAIAASENLDVLQFDVKTAFLHGNLEEYVCSEIPTGFVEIVGDLLSDEDHQLIKEGAICELKKSIYGLKQAGLCWFVRFRDFLVNDVGFRPSLTDPCLFIGKNCFLVLYVDDGLIFSTSRRMGEKILKKIESEFDVKSMGSPRFFLGWKIDMSERGIFISQPAYIEKLAQKYGPLKRVSTPMSTSFDVNRPGTLVQDSDYRGIIGSLMFAAVGTRPDIAFATSSLSRYLDQPTKAREAAARNLCGYLEATKHWGIFYEAGNDLKLCAYADASYGGEKDKRSRSGYLVFITNAPVYWGARRQTLVTLSTSEAEYVSLAESCRDVKTALNLLSELGRATDQSVVCYEDNQTAKKMAEELTTKRSKHIDIKYHYVRELCAKKIIALEDCRSELMIADALTKALPKVAFVKHRSHMMKRRCYRCAVVSTSLCRCG